MLLRTLLVIAVAALAWRWYATRNDPAAPLPDLPPFLQPDAGDLPIAADPAPIAPAPAVLGGPPHAADLLRVAGVEYRVVGQPTSVGLVPVQRVYTGDRLAPQLVELYDPERAGVTEPPRPPKARCDRVRANETRPPSPRS